MTLLFLDISGGEILVIVLVALIIFGPKQAGAMVRKAGKALSEVKRATSSIKDEIMKETDEVKEAVSKPLQEVAEEAKQVNLMYGTGDKDNNFSEERDKKETERTTRV